MTQMQALNWLFSSPLVFLLAMTLICMFGTFMATRQLRPAILVAFVSLMYASFSNEPYITGLFYVLVVVLSILMANQIWDLVIGTGDESGGV